MTKADIVRRVREEIGFSEKEAVDVVEATLEIIKECLENGGSMFIQEFGTFVVKDTRPRRARNPSTGEWITIRGRKSVKFRSSKALRESLNQNPEEDV